MKIFTPIIVVVIIYLTENFGLIINTSRSCPHVILENGKTRIRGRGRSIKFQCYDGFTLIGNRYASCTLGKWDTPIPICVSPNCPPALPKPEHAHVVPTYQGAVLMYFCESGYMLIGNSQIYCNGKQWNGTAPYCRDTTAVAPTSCDFEQNLCWWEQDPIHDFDWTRRNFETPSSHIGTGPTNDHTFGRGRDGYYLYIEASGRLVNETARIISPLYNSSLTKSGCFSFWYHMFGVTIGSLNVYFKPETENAKLMFTESGNHGDEWLHGLFKLPVVDTNFQIIIEGVRGISYVSDIAVDDVAILQGDKCNVTIEATNATEHNDDQIEKVHAMQTCKGRCSYSYMPTRSSKYDPREICYCTVDCADYSLCCPDYYNYCITDATTMDILWSTMTTTTPSTTTRMTSSTVSSRNVIPINSTDGIDPVILQTNVANTRRTTTMVLEVETPFLFSTQKAQTKDDHNECESCHDDSNVIIKKKEHLLGRDVHVLGMASIFGIVVGLLAVVAITAVVAFVILHRRKTYKRGNSGSALSEDSDVRYLTSDEILDFNLARPSNDYEDLKFENAN